METLIGSIITGVTVMALIGLLWKNLGDKVQDNKNLKVNKETCKIIHVETDKKFETLFTEMKEQSKMLSDISSDVKVIAKGINGG